MPKVTVTAEVCRKLAEHLTKGDWAEGERIPSERELCEMLSVGRASLREALKALEIMGLIEVRVGDGTFVCHHSEFMSRPLLWAMSGSTASDMREVIEARRALELEIAVFAAQRATAEDLAEIGKHLDAMERAGQNVESFLEAELNFHIAVAAASKNRILQNAMNLLRTLMRQWLAELLQNKGIPADAVQEHQAIFLALAKKNSAAARDAMGAHLAHVASALIQPRRG